MRLLYFISFICMAAVALAQENPTNTKPDSLKQIVPADSLKVNSYATEGLDQEDEKPQADPYSYFAIKFNYGFRPVRRPRSTVEIGIDSATSKFMTPIVDSFNISAINDLKGFSMGFEIGFDNRFFMDYMIDFISRTRGKHNTNAVTLEGNVGYNFKLMPKYNIFIRPSLGLFYSRLNTRLGTYESYSYYYLPIEVKQSSTLCGLRPRLQVEVPIQHFDDVGSVFIRFEVGYNASVYLSRFIKLRAQQSEPNERDNHPYSAERYYLDGENSGYLYNNQHVNQPITLMGGHFLGVEVGFKFGE